MSRSPMKKPAADWIALVEAAYTLDGDDAAWLAGLLKLATRDHWQTGISCAFTFDMPGNVPLVRDILVNGPPETTLQIQAVIQNASFDRWPDQDEMFRRQTAGLQPDTLGVVTHSGTGRGLVMTWALASPRPSTAAERHYWARCSAHFGAALRLRALGSELASLDAEPVEAVLDGGGKIHDVRGEALGRTAREALRDAVRAIDRARSRDGRRDADGALGAWEALVRGRWSLVDRFDSDRRRFVVAVRNDPRFADPRGLSQRERQVAEYIGLGHSAKQIGYLLGVPAASVENSIRRAQTKFGLGSRVELAAFFAPGGLRARLAEVAVAGDRLMIGSLPLLDETKISGLTGAERQVLALLIAGSTNRDIGARRATSERTVANQIQTIFRKFAVRSRTELLARLGGT